jgi:SAM-dependent methyltransferase/methyltransferase-like protein
MSETAAFAYDKVLYPNYLHAQTHPDRLATMTRFFGVDAKPVENCRVLELGCGTGSSLLSFALDLPESRFVGIDLSEKQIEIGKTAAEAVGLKNLEFRQGDIMEISREEYGEFDYIIAHGLYSWVPEPVRDQILKICREILAPNGVAFISYNTLPGCHFRQMAREMMLFYTRDISAPIEKVQQSLGFLKFVADSALSDKVHKKVLEEEFKKLSKRGFENIFHDDLSEINYPLYFHQFIDHAKKHDLQFVTEVEYFPTQNGIYPREVMDVLHQISDDVIALEQYLDFIEGRLFRHTLLCHKEVELNRLPDAKILREVRISSPLRPASEKPELASSKHEVFVGGKDEAIEINHPLTKAAFFYLGKIWKDSTTFDELVEACRELLSSESGAEIEIDEQKERELGEMIFQIYAPSFLRFHTHQPAFAAKPGEKPVASALARWQSRFDDTVSTLLCTQFIIKDDLGKELLRLLDGTRDRSRLIDDMTDFIRSEKFAQPADVKKHLIQNLPEQLERSLNIFAEKALLVS